MNYPIWDLVSTGGGLIIAIVAAIHVYIAHFAVGGGLFLVVTEQKSYKAENSGMTNYVKSHTKFFLLLTMVLGALTGVGIWLSISAVHPSVTSVMIHTFVFAWASEWVFFTVEIISLLVYYYTFGKMSRKNHLIVGWIYFIAAWISLVIINAIISFMLTPGQWIETKSFWDGLLNPSFVPSTLFRTALAVMFAGLYGFITSNNLKDVKLRQQMTSYCSKWVVLPLILLVPSGYWYLQTIPPVAQSMVTKSTLDPALFAKSFLIITPIIIIGAIVMALKLSKGVRKPLAAGLLILGFLCLGSFEYVRETARRPYVIYNHMYSNSLLKGQEIKTRQTGILQYAKWAGVKKVTPDTQLAAGKELFRLLCVSCHSMGGPRNDILKQTKDMSDKDILKVMDQMGNSKNYMPPFSGNKKESKALAIYLQKMTP